MGQNYHNIVSNPYFYTPLILLHLHQFQKTPLWYWDYEKVKSHGSKIILINITINGIGCWIVRGYYKAAT